ncbi:MAG: hypothetical protein HYT98_02315 [Candidatus Sungbacteria bacterium]|nr:hypothetical protein [Candidatus Sungbacteria bacterium]
MKTKLTLRWHRFSIALAFISTLFAFAGQLTLRLALAQEKPQEQYIFQMMDGYFQVRNSQPIHLIHAPLPKTYLYLGDEYRVWIAITLRDGLKSPCSRRSEKKCTFLHEVIEKGENDENRVRILWDDFQTDGGKNHYSISIPGDISKKMAFGDAVIRFRVVKSEEVLFSYEIQIEVK